MEGWAYEECGMMKVMYKLEEIDTKEKETVFVTSYIYRPVEAHYDGLSSIKVGGENSKAILEALGLPDCIGDVIEVDFSPKQTQTKIEVGDEDGVQDKGTSKKTRKGYRRA